MLVTSRMTIPILKKNPELNLCHWSITISYIHMYMYKYIYIYIHNYLHSYLKQEKKNSKRQKSAPKASTSLPFNQKNLSGKTLFATKLFSSKLLEGPWFDNTSNQHSSPTSSPPHPREKLSPAHVDSQGFSGPGPQPSSLMIQVVASPYNPITRQWINGSMVPSNPRASHDRYNAKSEWFDDWVPLQSCSPARSGAASMVRILRWPKSPTQTTNWQP